MTEILTPDYLIALPEMFLATPSLVLLMVGVFIGNRSTTLLTWLSVLAVGVAFVMVIVGTHDTTVTLSGMFISDSFTVFMKSLVLVGAAIALIISTGYLKRENISRFEYPILILFATLGMLLMISAHDLIALYVGIELQSLSLYILAAFSRESQRSSEAGLKYFVLGALSSGMLLYGFSLIYGFSGFTAFDQIASVLSHGDALAGDMSSIGILVGLVFVIAALAFKISAVPFHMWTPDVYEGAPTPVTAFFAAAPKIAGMAVILRVLLDPFYNLAHQWEQIIIFVSIASMILGAFAAIGQNSIKRLIAYSSIGHVGYGLVGLSAGTIEGVRGVLIYMAIYMVMSLGTFACILAMRRRGKMVEKIDDLAGLSKSNPGLAIAFAIFMFSMAGIPPLAGFFGKLYVFLAAIEEQLYLLAIIGVLSSAVGAFYYIRIVKLMYFDDALEGFDKPIGKEISGVLVSTGILILLFFAYPTPVLDGAQAAAELLLR